VLLALFFFSSFSVFFFLTARLAGTPMPSLRNGALEQILDFRPRVPWLSSFYLLSAWAPAMIPAPLRDRFLDMGTVGTLETNATSPNLPSAWLFAFPVPAPSRTLELSSELVCAVFTGFIFFPPLIT